MVICLERDADLHMAQLMPLPLTVSCFSKIQIGFTFLIPAHPGSPGKRAIKRVCVCAMILKHTHSQITTSQKKTEVDSKKAEKGCAWAHMYTLTDKQTTRKHNAPGPIHWMGKCSKIKSIQKCENEIRSVAHTVSLLKHEEAFKLLCAGSKLHVSPHEPQRLHLGVHRLALLIADTHILLHTTPV